LTGFTLNGVIPTAPLGVCLVAAKSGVPFGAYVTDRLGDSVTA